METEFRLGDYIKILKKRYLFLIVPIVVLFGASAGVAVMLPPLYESKGIILIESPQISKEIVAGAVDSAARERIAVIEQRVMTRTNLIRIANEFGVFGNSEKKPSSTDIVAAMRSGATVEFVSAGASRRSQTTIAFTVSFEHRSPQIAARVANEIVTLFMDENVKTRTKIATETTDFLNQEAQKLEDVLAEIEGKIATYKQENSNSLPENLDIRMAMRERAEAQIRETSREIKAHEEELRFLDIQLSSLKTSLGQVNSAVSNASSASGGSATSVDTTNPELEKLRTQYELAKSKYAPAHPDLKRLAREVESLEDQLIAEGGAQGIGVQISRLETKKDEAIAAGKTAEADSASDEIAKLYEQLQAGAVDTNRSNLLDQKVAQQKSAFEAQRAQAKAQIELNIANVETKIAVTNERIASLRDQQNELAERLEEIEKAILQTPLADRALKTLNRDYANAQQKYNEVRAKAMEAQIAENVEEASKAERFVLVEPPTLPDEPIKPNRPQIILLGLALSIGTGVASVFGVEFIDGSIRGTAGVIAVTNMAPIATIPYILTSNEYLKRRRRRIGLLIGAVLAGMIGLAGIHFVYKPLDQIFYKVVDRLN
ncbi:hypothetical protein EOI86_23580 [Hwanghaeella grinnelliae]|uniref:Lipopolysaccharide biosynthesis protein n=1 Tax=Hwanghaeella grinnelliae TaxID=2500179 RepID=A0A3S2W2F6_9PROT|nr:hypothetical protein [Hwanghaeella grinnelliae]RVU34100.1 hypothetical protein EOI86_23580 [Hwanghaeella grinnelliae]